MAQVGRPRKHRYPVVLAFRVESELADRVYEQAERRSVTQSEILARAVEQYVTKLERQKVTRLP